MEKLTLDDPIKNPLFIKFMYSMAALHSTHYLVINTLTDYIMDALIVISLEQ